MSEPSFIRKQVALAGFTTLGVGGPADYFADINNESDLATAYKFARENLLNIFALGRGSNVLFADDGFRGLVLRINLDSVHFENGQFWVGSGVQISRLVKAVTAGCTGFECFAGLPGTVGGAIYGNAGCYGGQFWDVVVTVRFYDVDCFKELASGPNIFGYRWSIFKEHPDWIITAARLKTQPGKSELIAKETERILKLRQESQPKAKSCGCFFRNPENATAGQLIERAGLKGTRVGNAQVSDVHANFFVNLGGASADDFLRLAEIVKSEVLAKFRILLQEEIIKV